MADDFDQTQALFLDEFEQDTDEDNQKNREPVKYFYNFCLTFDYIIQLNDFF